MSVSLLEERRRSPPAPCRTPIIAKSVELEEPRLRLSNRSVTSDEEIAFVKKAVIWMCFLKTLLILFLIVNYFHPELFRTPIAPNEAGDTP